VTEDADRDEVLAWMAERHASATGAARHFHPTANAAERGRIAARYRKWWERYQDDLPAVTRTVTPVTIVTTAPPDLGNLPPVERLQWQLEGVIADLTAARIDKDLRTASVIDRRLSEVGAELEEAKRAANKVLRLERTPIAVAAALEPKVEAIRIRAEMRKRAAARAAAAAAAETKPEEEP
jgi:hypothetical protein